MTELVIKCTQEQCRWFTLFIGVDVKIDKFTSIVRIKYVHDMIKYELVFVMNGGEHFADVYYDFESILEKFKIMQPGKPLEISKKNPNFATALEDIKAGKSVTRAAWMLKGWQLSLLFKHGVTYNQVKTHLGLYADDEKVGDYPFKFIVTNEKGHMVNDNYQLTAEDILAQDWHAIN